MPGPDQKIKTILIPELGLDLDPEFIEQSVVGPDFSRVFSFLVGKVADRGILIRASSDGSLRVVSAGVPFEIYIVFSGTGSNDYTAPNTEEYLDAHSVSDFLVENNPAIISFRDFEGSWLPDKSLPVGYHSIEFIHYGIRIKNRIEDSVTTFEVTAYR